MARRKREWFDEDSFWQELYPYMFPKERFTQTPEEVEKALALTQPSGRAALDLCCGPGRFSIALAQAGFEVYAPEVEAAFEGTIDTNIEP